jgi:hypothetical protein
MVGHTARLAAVNLVPWLTSPETFGVPYNATNGLIPFAPKI